MTEDDPAFEFEAKIQRGTGTDDRDTFKAKVSAETVDELDEKVQQMHAKVETWAGEFREIQPQEGRDLSQDQSTLGATANGDGGGA